MWENIRTGSLDRPGPLEAESQGCHLSPGFPPGDPPAEAPSPRDSRQEGDVATSQKDLGTKPSGLRFRRFFTRDGVHPFDEVEWEIRDAVIPNLKEGGNAFEQRGVEFPKSWSQNATNIVAQKYFRGQLGTPQRETSVRQMVGRVADTITHWGQKDS